MTADGWRPILSSRPQSDYKPYENLIAPSQLTPQQVSPTPQQDPRPPITSYRNNSSSSESKPQNTFKQKKKTNEQVLSAPNSNILTSMNLGKIFGNNQDIILHGNNFMSPPPRNHGSMYHGSHSSHSNFKVPNTSSPFGSTFSKTNTFRHHPSMGGKLPGHNMASSNKRHKPSILAASTRDEVYLAPPSGLLGNLGK